LLTIGRRLDNGRAQTGSGEDGTNVALEVPYQTLSGDHVSRSEHLSTRNTVRMIRLQQSHQLIQKSYPFICTAQEQQSKIF